MISDASLATKALCSSYNLIISTLLWELIMNKGGASDDLVEVPSLVFSAVRSKNNTDMKLEIVKYQDKILDVIKRILLHKKNIQFTLLNIASFRQVNISASSLSPSFDKLAVIVKPGIVLTFCVRSVMFYLGPSWRLEVRHSNLNADFVKSSLSDILNVNYVLLPSSVVYISKYNSMLK